MEEQNSNINNNNYLKEKKFKEKLKEEILINMQKNLNNTFMVFDGFVDKLVKLYKEKNLPLIKEYCQKNLNEEKTEERLEQENKKINDTSENIKNLIKKDLENAGTEDIRDLRNKMSEIFDFSLLNPNIKIIYNQIKNNEFTSEKLDEKLNESIKQFEEVFKIYLLKKMKYKEELEIYNNRQGQIINENINIKEDYENINKYLNNFKTENNINNDYKKLKELIQSVKDNKGKKKEDN